MKLEAMEKFRWAFICMHVEWIVEWIIGTWNKWDTEQNPNRTKSYVEETTL